MINKLLLGLFLLLGVTAWGQNSCYPGQAIGSRAGFNNMAQVIPGAQIFVSPGPVFVSASSGGTLSLPIVADQNGNYTICTTPGTTQTVTVTGAAQIPATYQVSFPITINGSASLSGTNTFTGSNVFQGPGLIAGRLNNIAYVDGVTYTTVQQAINSFGGSPGTVIVPPGYLGTATFTVTLPDGVSVLDYSVSGRPRLYVNPVSTPGGIGASCGFSVVDGAPSFSATGPAANNCVMWYGAALTTNANPSQWGSNVVLQAGTGVSGGNLTGYEADMNPVAGTVASIGFFAVAAGQTQTTATQTAFDCFTANNSVPLGAWKTCFTINGLSGSAFFFGPKDTGMQLTQAVTASGSPQTVTTNGACSTPTSQLWVGTVLSVDSGGTQEDVTILPGTNCSGGVFSIVAVFSQNHANPTNFTEYGMQRIWDAGAVVAQNIPYVWGNIQNYNTSNTPNVLSFGVGDAAGTIRVSEFFTATGQHTWRDVGTTGYSWQSQAGGVLLALSDTGAMQLLSKTVGTTNNSGTGLYATKRAVAPCTTAASVGAVCTVTATWATAFPDSNYTATCQGNGVGSGVPVIGALTVKGASAVTVQTVAITAVAAAFTTVECTAVHD